MTGKEEAQQKLQEMQLLEQNMQGIGQQKQQFQQQLIEVSASSDKIVMVSEIFALTFFGTVESSFKSASASTIPWISFVIIILS